MTKDEVIQFLKKNGDPNTKKTLLRHGAREPFFGCKIGEMKTIEKKVKKDHKLSLELYDSGISDAMYLAGLIADEKKITKADLSKWAKSATWHMISEYTVAWVAAESEFGFELAMEWIDAKSEAIASSGWNTLASLATIKPDEELDLKAWEKLIKRVVSEIHKAPNRVRYTMNNFLIATGSYINSLQEKAIAASEKIGKVQVDMGDTDCKLPSAAVYIAKSRARNPTGKKKKKARC